MDTSMNFESSRSPDTNERIEQPEMPKVVFSDKDKGVLRLFFIVSGPDELSRFCGLTAERIREVVDTPECATSNENLALLPLLNWFSQKYEDQFRNWRGSKQDFQRALAEWALTVRSEAVEAFGE